MAGPPKGTRENGRTGPSRSRHAARRGAARVPAPAAGNPGRAGARPAMGALSYMAEAGRLRAATRLRVVESILDEGPLARTDIARVTGLSPATLSEVTGVLIEEGLLVEER